MNENRVIISNDDGWIMSNMTGPVTPDTISEMMVHTYAGTPIGGVSWCVGNSEAYEYETEVGERTGNQNKHFSTSQEYWLQRNLHDLIESCGGPLTEINRQFRESDIDIFPSLRMNSHYDIPYAAPGHGQFRRQHPEWLIGQPYEEIPFPTLEHAIARGLDYKFPGVREHMLKVIYELIERFDLAGIELDYFRHPAFFRIEEAYTNRYLMTDFIRRVRLKLDEVGKKRNKYLDLIVRVPSSPYDARRIGLDVEVWIKEGLVDIVAAGGGFLPFEQPIRDFVEIAEDTDCLIYGSFEALRWALDEEIVYALAARFWDSGVDGFYLFNYFNTPNNWKRRILGNMVDRNRLSHLDKQYELDHSDRIAEKTAHVGAFRYASAWASLPVFMEETQPRSGSVLHLDVADDLGRARESGTLDSCQISLGFVDLAKDDQLEVFLNNQPLAWESRQSTEDGWQKTVFDGEVYHTTMAQETTRGSLITFDVTDTAINRGMNELLVRLIKGASPRFDPVVLTEVRLNISYH